MPKMPCEYENCARFLLRLGAATKNIFGGRGESVRKQWYLKELLLLAL
jgi:hypothetical protein